MLNRCFVRVSEDINWTRDIAISSIFLREVLSSSSLIKSPLKLQVQVHPMVEENELHQQGIYVPQNISEGRRSDSFSAFFWDLGTMVVEESCITQFCTWASSICWKRSGWRDWDYEKKSQEISPAGTVSQLKSQIGAYQMQDEVR